MGEAKLAWMKASRRDISDLLIHWTKAQTIDGEPMNARAVLLKILRDGKLNGGTGFIKGGYKCICFTESPIAELAAIFRQLTVTDQRLRPPYEPYGVAVRKNWLFKMGGRPVIYQPESDLALLDGALKYRHVTYDPADGVDFTWEREWRIRADSLELDVRNSLVVVPRTDEAFDIMTEYADIEPTDCDPEDGSPAGGMAVAALMVVSLEFLGVRWPPDEP